MYACPACDGTGDVFEPAPDGRGRISYQCQVCEGLGEFESTEALEAAVEAADG